VGEHVSDEADRKVRAMAPTLAPVADALGHASTMLGIEPEARPPGGIGTDATMMGLPAKPPASIGSDPTMMGLPAKAGASIGSDPTMRGLPAKAPASIGSDPTIAGLPAEPPRASKPPQPVPVPLAAPPSPRATSLPLVTPTMAPVAPPRRVRPLLIAGAVAAALVLGGITWAALRPRASASASATVEEPSSPAMDGSTHAPAAVPASKRALKPPPDAELTKPADEKNGGRSRRGRRVLGRFRF
jgi:hypothetical protein